MAFYPYQYETPQYGQKDYEQALRQYDAYTGKYAGLVGKGIEELGDITSYYKPGGGYGEGLRTEARETVRGGLAESLGSMVKSGMSSQFGTRGVNVLAASELSKLYKNIEDTRNQLLQQAFTPYAQLIQTLGQLAAAAPRRTQYVTPGKPSISGYGTPF